MGLAARSREWSRDEHAESNPFFPKHRLALRPIYGPQDAAEYGVESRKGDSSLKPLMVELYAGLHGWGEGAIAEGFQVIGFDIVDMCSALGHQRLKGIELVLQDVLTLHGSQFRNAACIVASPPCQAYSYRAMPWKKAKALPPPDNSLFEACFRIQREACEAAGRHIPLVVENVRGAQKWVGRARWHFGSYFLWGDVPALMPITLKTRMKYQSSCSERAWKDREVPRLNDGLKTVDRRDVTNRNMDCDAIGSCVEEGTESVGEILSGTKVAGLDWSKHGTPGYKAQAFNATAAKRFREGVKQSGISGTRRKRKGPTAGFRTEPRRMGSKSDSRKAASAQIAKIPFPLAQHIARSFYAERILEGKAVAL